MREGWVQTSLEEVAEVIMGQSPDGKSYNQSGEGLPFMQGSAEFGEHHPIPEKWCSDPKKIAEPGDLLLSVRAPVGDTNFANQRIAVGRGLSVIRANSESLTEFIRLVIQLNVSDMLALSGSGMFSSITGKNLKEFKVLLPPLPEQKRIVDLMSSVDTYIEALQQQLESAKKSRNAMLHDLLTAVGEEWVETTLGEASEVIMGRQLSPSKKLGTRPRPYIRAANIGSWGIDLEDIYEMDFTEIEEVRFACQVGDTILVEGGNEKSVGCPAFITDKEAGLCIQNTVIRCRSKNSKLLDPHFQYHLLRFMFWRGDFSQLCAGTTIMHLGQKRAEVVPILIPPLGKQLDIVDTISKFDLAITNFENTLKSAKSLRSGLLSDLITGQHEIPASYDKVIGAA